MAKQLQIRGGTTVQHSTFTGALREITIDTDKDVVVVHDGTTVGGFPLAKQTSVDSKVDKVTSTDNAVVRFDGTTGQVQNSVVTISDTGNINFPTGARITGDFSNATESNRVVFQTSTSNSATAIGIVPSGTSNIAVSRIFNSSDTNNSSIGHFRIDANSVGIWSSKFGSGSYVPIMFYTSDAERMRIDTTGNVLLTSGTGAFGYGTGAGGTVTQLTSKSTAVTLNKPTGQITMSNAALAAGASVTFGIINSLVSATDTVVVDGVYGTYDLKNYRIEKTHVMAGAIGVRVTNVSVFSLSEAIPINFTIFKGAIA